MGQLAKSRHRKQEVGHSHTPRQLAFAFRQQGRLPEAADCYRQVLLQAPDDAETHNNLGVTLQELGRLEAAIACYRQAIECRPGFAGAYDNLGVALLAHGAHEEAITCHRHAIALAPGMASAQNHLGVALKQRGALSAAIAAYRRALEIDPTFAKAHNNLGVALQDQGESGAAIACYQQAIAHQPDFAAAHANLGVVLQETGELAESFAAFQTATALAPRHGAFQRMLVETGRLAPGSPAAERLEAMAAGLDQMPEPDQRDFHFALGMYCATKGEIERSFAHLLAGNRLHRRRVPYLEAATLALFDRIKKVFTHEILATRTERNTSLPIFVVGMPRSGTTLVEQILASHPDITGAGEIHDLPNLLKCLPGNGFPESLAQASQDTLTQLGDAYLAGLRARAPQSAHIVDKLPENFLNIGLIHMALPGARIIHVVRDPLDTCLSCFSKLFNAGVAYSYDLGELGRYYRAYRDMMAHWRTVLPAGGIFEIRYEDIVSDLAGQVRNLLTYCDIAWNDACLTFDRTHRSVQTASATQVRQPIYTNSVGRWRELANLARPELGL